MTRSMYPSPERRPAPPPPKGGEALVAVVAAVPAELEPLRAAVGSATPTVVGRRPATRGVLDGVPVLLLAAGMGKTNAAQALTALLEHEPVALVLNVGVAGAYPGAGLAVGDVALASLEVYGDEGVATPTGWISTEAIGIPLLQDGVTRRFNRFPLDGTLVERAAAHLSERGIGVTTGPFVTVSCCSGTGPRGAELAARFPGALCESMEGAALAHVAALYDAPFLELRGVSNAVEDRDLSRWRLDEAIDAACHAARALCPFVVLLPAGATDRPLGPG